MSRIEPSRYSMPFAYNVLIAYYAIIPHFYLLYPLYAKNLLIQILYRTLEPVLILSFGTACLIRRPKLHRYVVMMALAGGYAAAMGLANGHGFRNVAGGVSHLVAGLLLYTYFRSLPCDSASLRTFYRRFTWVTVPSYVFVIVVMLNYVLLFGRGLYFGLGTHAMLLPVFWFVYGQNLVGFLGTLMIIFFSGKRGVLVAALTVFAAFAWRGLNEKKWFFAKLITIGIALAVGAVILNSETSLENNRLVRKFSPDTRKNLDSYTSGRYDEATSAFAYWTKFPERFWLGTGFGFRFPYIRSDPSLPEMQNWNNVHFSPINLVVIWGAVLGPILGVLILLELLQAVGSLSDDAAVLRLTVCALVIYSLFTFTLLNDPMLWAGMGMLRAYRSPDGRQDGDR